MRAESVDVEVASHGQTLQQQQQRVLETHVQMSMRDSVQLKLMRRGAHKFFSLVKRAPGDLVWSSHCT